jgi:Sigma-70 factor, region 1.1
MVSDAEAVDRLVALAARRGSLSTEELRHVLPIDAMSVDELASLIARLEDRGVTVDIDAALLSPTRRPSDQPRAAPDILPPPEPPRPAPSVRPVARPAAPAPARPPERDTSAAPRVTGTSRPTQLGLILVVIFVVILALLMIGFVGLG